MSLRLQNKIGKDTAQEFRLILNEIIELLEKDLQSSVANMRKEANFQNAAWAYEQAMFVGEQRALTKVIELLTVKEAKNGSLRFALCHMIQP